MNPVALFPAWRLALHRFGISVGRRGHGGGQPALGPEAAQSWRTLMRRQRIREMLVKARSNLPVAPAGRTAGSLSPKLDNLRRAAGTGFPVPEPTYWAYAADLQREPDACRALTAPVGLPCIVRSVSPTEDTAEGSRAGQFLSLVVQDARDFPDAVARVIASLPVREGHRLGAVAVQPYLIHPRAGSHLLRRILLRGKRDPGAERRGHVRPSSEGRSDGDKSSEGSRGANG